MSNLASILKSEISRLARREAKRLVAPLKVQVTQLRRAAKDQRVRVVALERRHAQAARQATIASTGKAAKAESVGDGTRLGPRSIRAQRARLGLSQAELGRLLGVSHITVYQWESGRAKPRGMSRNALVGLRDLGRREVKARLAEAPAVMKRKAKKVGKPARGRKPAAKATSRGRSKPATSGTPTRTRISQWA